MTKTPKIRTRHDRRAAAQPAIAAPAVESGPELFRPTLHAQIRPDPANPRKLFEADGLVELAASIVRDGLLEPLVIRAVDGEPGVYMLIAGERRWRAIGQAIAAGAWPAERAISAMLRDVSETDARRLALVENLQRRDLNAIEEARAVAALVELTGSSAAQIGEELGFTPRWAQQRLSLLKLPPAVQAQVEAGRIKLEHARELVGLLPQLPAVQQLAIERGAIDVQTAKDWLAKQPKPLTLSADAWILALEVYDKSQRAPLEPSGRYVEVDADARFDARLKPLTEYPSYLLYGVSHVLDGGAESGQFQVGVTYEAERQFRIKFGDDITTERGRLRALDALYAELGAAHTPPLYRTRWLTGPFELSDSLRQEIAQARSARAQRDATWQAERDAEDAARARAQQAEIDRRQAVRAEAVAIVGRPAAERPDALTALAQLAAHPLPWSLNADGSIVNADGEIVQRNAHWQLTPQQLANLQLIVALVNAGAGLTTPDKVTPKDPDAPTREAFVFQVAGALQEDADGDLANDEASRQAEAGLAAFLRQEATDYADRDYDWGPDGVQQLALLIRDEGLGRQVDLEEAIASEGAARTPSRLALAGVSAET